MDQKRKQKIANRLESVKDSVAYAEEALAKEDEDEIENQIDLASEEILAALVLAEERT